jgi:radical SAM modification target selenobiotic family peptide
MAMNLVKGKIIRLLFYNNGDISLADRRRRTPTAAVCPRYPIDANHGIDLSFLLAYSRLTSPQASDSFYSYWFAVSSTLSIPPSHQSVCQVPAPGELDVSPLTAQEATMDADDLKKILAGFCIAGLIAGSTFTLSGCAAGKSA